MQLPSDATIATAKLTDYLLKPRPQDDKSAFLARAGYALENWQQLEQDLRKQILPLGAIPKKATRFGQTYEIRGTLCGPNNRILQVVTVWMTEWETGSTKFITLFPNKEVGT